MVSIVLGFFLAAAGKTSAPAFVPAASECVFKLTGTGFMTFGLDVDGKSQPFPTGVIKIPKKCLKETITFSLRYDGDGKKNVMGHNIVLAEAGDLQKILDGSRTAKIEQDFLGDEVRKLIVGMTKMIGEKEADSFSLPPGTLKETKDYGYFCSFPGHAGLMKGKIKFE